MMKMGAVDAVQRPHGGTWQLRYAGNRRDPGRNALWRWDTP